VDMDREHLRMAGHIARKAAANTSRVRHAAQFARALFPLCASLMFYPHAVAAQSATNQALVSPRPGSVVKAQFDDWKHECSKPPGAKVEICAITQDVSDESNSEIGVSVHVQKVAGGESILRVIAPLGVLLTQNLAVKVDGEYLGEAPFLRCYVLGCQAQIELDEKLRAKMFTGTTLLLIVHRTREQGVGIPVSLKGFSKAYAVLK
jgi:invasion protein IalB